MLGTKTCFVLGRDIGMGRLQQVSCQEKMMRLRTHASEVTPFLTLRPTALVAAFFLTFMTLVLAYLGGVMLGRNHGSRQTEVTAAVATSQENATNSAETEAPDDAVAQKILAPEDLRFYRVLHNEGIGTEGDGQAQGRVPRTPPRSSASGGASTPPTTAGTETPAMRTPAPQQATEAGRGTAMYDYVFQVAAFRDGDTVDALRQRLEGRGLRTRMQRQGKLYVVLVLLRGDAQRAAEVQRTTESMGLGKPIQRSRTAVVPQR